MRYLRNLGLDAYLLTYENEISHFTPENDTWDYEKWKPYIIPTKVVNGGLKHYFSYSRKHLLRELGGYDYYVANGFAPALFRKAGLTVDLFLPYCIGIEYTYFYNKSKFKQSFAEIIFKFYQLKGLKNNVKLVGTIDKESLEKAKKYDLKTVNLAMPMVFVEQNADHDNELLAVIEKIKKYDLVVFSHVSHFQNDTYGFSVKRNDIGIRGFANFILRSGSKASILVLLDYGPGVEQSKKLIEDLGIEDNVLWLPKMDRKRLMSIIAHIDIGFGEFGGHMWGGTVWEFMASGKPFFQFVNLNNEEIAKLLNAPGPTFFNTSDENEISTILEDIPINREKYINIGNELKNWFNTNNGMGLAYQYKQIISG